MTDNNETLNIDDNFADVSAADLFDAPVELSPEEIERNRRRKPATGIRSAGANGADWLLGKAPPGQRPLLTERRNCMFSGEYKDVLYMPLGKVGLLAAPGGSGKTTILMQLAASVASGADWLGRYKVEKPGRVLVILGEEDEDNIDLLVWKAARAIIGPPAHKDLLTYADGQNERATAIGANLHTWSVSGMRVDIEYQRDGGRESYGEFHDGLRSYLAADRAAGGGEWSLIIIDPAARFFPADAEKDNAQATRFVESLEVLTAMHGNPAVIFAHHSPKDTRSSSAASANDARGASAFVDGSRWMGVLQVEGTGTGTPLTTLHVKKSNYGPQSSRVLKRQDYSEGGGFKVVIGQEADELKIAAMIDIFRAIDATKALEYEAEERYKSWKADNRAAKESAAEFRNIIQPEKVRAEDII